jgi:hypothetical protein
MKNLYKIILVSVFIIFGANVQAQYQSIFGVNHTVWKTSNCGALGAPCFVDRINTTGIDTLINGILFKEVTPRRHSPFYVGEDTSTGKVWSFSWSILDTIMEEMMDLSLNVNDSFLFGDPGFGFKYRVDSVYFENSRKVIRFDHQFRVTVVGQNVPMVNLKMIEGVGLNVGVDMQEINGLGVYLLCQEKDSVRVFQTNEHPTLDCNSNPTSLPEESLTNQIAIQPNPASTYVELNMNGLVVDRVEIFDVKGSLIQSFNNTADRLDVSKIENGIYFLRIHSIEGVISRKLVVSR